MPKFLGRHRLEFELFVVAVVIDGGALIGVCAVGAQIARAVGL
jgi:hypothetical protein